MPDPTLHADLPRDLHYVDDSQPGIRRKKVRGKFSYYDTKGKRITNVDDIKRLDALAVPPAYTDVWICADPQGHLQATGRDARGRKQYRYHPRWRELRDTDKYAQLQAFGKALPKLRKQLKAQIAVPGFTREKVLATVVMLLDVTLIRVGNTQYAKENKSYGLTTLSYRSRVHRQGLSYLGRHGHGIGRATRVGMAAGIGRERPCGRHGQGGCQTIG